MMTRMIWATKTKKSLADRTSRKRKAREATGVEVDGGNIRQAMTRSRQVVPIQSTAASIAANLRLLNILQAIVEANQRRRQACWTP